MKPERMDDRKEAGRNGDTMESFLNQYLPCLTAVVFETIDHKGGFIFYHLI